MTDRFDEIRIKEHLAVASKTSQRIWNLKIEYPRLDTTGYVAQLKLPEIHSEFREDVEDYVRADNRFVSLALNNYVYALEEIQRLRSYINLLESEIKNLDSEDDT